MNGFEEFMAAMYVLEKVNAYIIIEGVTMQIKFVDIEDNLEGARDFVLRVSGEESKYILRYRIYASDHVLFEFSDDTNTCGYVVVNRNEGQVFKFGWKSDFEVDKSRTDLYTHNRSADQILKKGA